MRTANNNDNAIFPKGNRVPAEYFTGAAWLTPLVPKDDIFNTVISSVMFEAGARNNWHTHPAGQILLCTHGIGYYQEKSKPIQVLNVGDVVTIAPGIVHWHGASPDSDFTHIAISPNAQNGVVDWLQPVTDEEYLSLNK